MNSFFSYLQRKMNKSSLIQQILSAGADPHQVQSALVSKVSPVVTDHRAMSKAMALVGGKKESLIQEMQVTERPPLTVYYEEYPDELDDSLASGWTISIPKH
tara:strand:+ start:296 stop:601 length:306 start_codon:yes stop_codon:yes gene_type:complete